jgi:hypothetical protein
MGTALMPATACIPGAAMSRRSERAHAKIIPSVRLCRNPSISDDYLEGNNSTRRSGLRFRQLLATSPESLRSDRILRVRVRPRSGLACTSCHGGGRGFSSPPSRRWSPTKPGAPNDPSDRLRRQQSLCWVQRHPCRHSVKRARAAGAISPWSHAKDLFERPAAVAGVAKTSIRCDRVRRPRHTFASHCRRRLSGGMANVADKRVGVCAHSQLRRGRRPVLLAELLEPVQAASKDDGTESAGQSRRPRLDPNGRTVGQ